MSKTSVSFQKQKNRDYLDKGNDNLDNDSCQNFEKLKNFKLKAKKNKAKYSDYDEYDEDQNNEILPKWKLFLVIGSIFLCFALLFPIVFSPLLNSIFGQNKNKNDKQTSRQETRPPSMSGRHQTPPSRNGLPLHHPHMRMPHVETASSQQSSGRGGMISWMMPFYTVGVVTFLGYTLYKIMFKKSKKHGKRYLNDKYSDESDYDLRVGGLGRRKMHIVQKRLQKTEKAMRQILEQLEKIAQTADINNDVPIETEKDCQENKINVAEEKQLNSNKNDSIHLSEEQVIQVEKGLRELKELSEIYKIQQNKVSEFDNEGDDFDHFPMLYSSSSETESQNFVEDDTKDTFIENEENSENLVRNNQKILKEKFNNNENEKNDMDKNSFNNAFENENFDKNSLVEENVKPVVITKKNKEKLKNVRRRICRE